MAHPLLSPSKLNAHWIEAYSKHEGTFPLFQFVISLVPRLRENLSLNGSLLVASATGFRISNGLTMPGLCEIAVAIKYDIGVPDILNALPMPLESEALEFAHFLAKAHASLSADIPSEVRAKGMKALEDFLRVVARKAKPKGRFH